MYYNCQSEEDLKKIYDKVMNSNIILNEHFFLLDAAKNEQKKASGGS
jgi:hypothetical protein